MPPKKMTANPVRAPRHFPGKVVADSSSDSDGDSDSDAAAAAPAPKAKPKPAPPRQTGAGKVISAGGSIAAADLSQRRAQAERDEAARKERVDMERRAAEEGFVTESESGSESEDDDDDGEEEGSSSEEESSEEEAPRRMVRPTFISRAQRNGTAAVAKKPTDAAEEAVRAEEVAAKQKKAAMDEMVEEQIRKDIAARAAGKKHWDDDEDSAEEVDTEDDVDPEAERAAWKLRELKRIKRHRERIEAREAELAEVERRRNLTEEERRAEDDAHIAKQKEEKDGRGKMGFMQKYFHKGAFYQDETKAEGLRDRDVMGARFADDPRNRELLPQALQMRDMTKLGRKGASKYKDLRSEDTGQWGRFDDHRPGKAPGFDKFGDERFQPDHPGGGREGAGPDGGQGANAIPLGRRKDIIITRLGNVTDRSGYDNMDRPRDSGRERRGSRSRSRSRSPRRDRTDDYRERRKRSSSRDRDRYDGDKRRKIENRY